MLWSVVWSWVVRLFRPPVVPEVVVGIDDGEVGLKGVLCHAQQGSVRGSPGPGVAPRGSQGRGWEPPAGAGGGGQKKG